MERLGHIEGMLNRDQRTAKLRFFHASDDVTCSSIVQKCFDNECSSTSRCSIISGTNQGCCCPARTKQKTSISYLDTWRRGYLLHRFQSLKNVLIVGVCLTLVTLPKVSSAPTNIRMSTRMKTQPKWINPCGIPPDATDVDHSSPGVSDFDLLTQIENQAIYALNKANDFKEQFAQKTFNMKLEDLHSMMKDQDYDWLEKLPKSLGEDIPDEHFQNLELNQTLLDVYRYLQTIAVGLEQVTWDQQDRQGHFSDEFRDAEQHLRNVLCELQMTIIERGIAMQADVTRDIMGDEFRNFDATQTKTRDWIIFRDYMNTLDYIVKVFAHMKEKSVA